MKKYITIVLAASSVLFLFSCKKYLAEDAQSFISTQTFYKTNTDAISAVNGVYAAMRNDVQGNLDPIWMSEMPADDVTAIGTPVGERLEIENLVYSSQHNFIRNTWANAFNVINRANTVIKYVDSSNISPALTRRIHGEARFLRAFYYTRLVQYYGDVPLLLTPSSPDSLYPKRTASSSIYNQIIDDLKYAEINLDDRYAYTDNQNGGRATKLAAKSLLGYVYLLMGGYPTNDASKFQLAADKFNEVVANKSRYNVDIQPIYKDIFDVTKKGINKEYVFYYAGTAGLSASVQGATRMQFWMYNFPSWGPTKEVYDGVRSLVYEPTDTRLTINLVKKSGTAVVPLTNTAGTIIIGKYIDNIATSADNAADWHAIRYSDVVLMYAEALIEVGGAANLTTALGLINSVRTPHAGAVPPLTFTTQDDLRQKLRLERRRELMFEGKRWQDLVRWGVFVPTMKSHLAFQYNRPATPNYDFVDQTRLLYPLPFIDYTANPNLRPQNPGYN